MKKVSPTLSIHYSSFFVGVTVSFIVATITLASVVLSVPTTTAQQPNCEYSIFPAPDNHPDYTIDDAVNDADDLATDERTGIPIITLSNDAPLSVAFFIDEECDDGRWSTIASDFSLEYQVRACVLDENWERSCTMIGAKKVAERGVQGENGESMFVVPFPADDWEDISVASDLDIAFTDTDVAIVSPPPFENGLPSHPVWEAMVRYESRPTISGEVDVPQVRTLSAASGRSLGGVPGDTPPPPQTPPPATPRPSAETPQPQPSNQIGSPTGQLAAARGESETIDGYTFTITSDIAGDDKINDAEDESDIIISGTVTHGSQSVSGLEITLNISGDKGGSPSTVTKTVTTNSSGRWSITLTPAEIKEFDEGTLGFSFFAFTNPTAGGGGTGIALGKNVEYDTTAPSVSQLLYAKDEAITDHITRGAVAPGTKIYTSISFSEGVKAVVGSGTSARPSIARAIGTTETLYRVVAVDTATLPNSACKQIQEDNQNDFVCLYTTRQSDVGKVFKTVVNERTTDIVGNPFASKYTSDKEIGVKNQGIGIDNDIVGADGHINAEEDDSTITISGSSIAIPTEKKITLTIDDSDSDATADITKNDIVIDTLTGEWSVDITSSEIQGLEEGVLSITAATTSTSGSALTAGKRITYDKTPPTIEITEPITGAARSKFVRAVMKDNIRINPTKSRYLISRSNYCGYETENILTDDTTGIAYTPGAGIALRSSDQNDNFVCFRAVDSAGNTAFKRTKNQITGIDSVAPILTNLDPIGTTGDTTPDFSFDSSEAGTISYGGACSSAITSAIQGVNTITFNSLSIGTYDNCTTTVTDVHGNASTPLAVPTFKVVRFFVTISAPEPDTPAQEKTVSATSSLEAQLWDYVVIDGATICDSSVDFASAHSYSAEGKILFTSESDNGKKVCFKVQYSGTTYYDVSQTIRGIDRTAPTLTNLSSIGTTGDTTPDFSFDSSEDGTISYGGRCRSTDTTATQGSNTVTFDDNDFDDNELIPSLYNDCTITVTDAAGNESTESVPEFTIVDFSITVTNPTSTDPEASKSVSAAVSHTTTEFKWVLVDGAAACDATTTFTSADDYTAGNQISVTSENNNGKKVCFRAEIGGDYYYKASDAISGIDTTAPRIQTTTYSTQADGSAASSIGAGSDIYTIVTFSESVIETQGNDGTARPSIKSKALKGSTEVIAEFQYDIVAQSATLASGDCKAKSNSDTSEYTCLYTTTTSITTDNSVFKTYVSDYTDKVSITGTAQTYDTAGSGVRITLPTKPTPSFSPANGSTVGAINSITIDFDEPIFRRIPTPAAGGGGWEAYRNTTVAELFSLGTVLNSNGSIRSSNVRVDSFTVDNTNNTITINLDQSRRPEGLVHLELRPVWGYGPGANKFASGPEDFAQISFTIDTSNPSVTINPLSVGSHINASEDDRSITISGTSNNVPSGTTVDIDIDDSDTDTSADVAFTATTDVSGNWSVAIVTQALQRLEEGLLTISANTPLSNSIDDTETVIYDRTVPSVSSTSYYSNEALSTALTGGVDEGGLIHTKIVFSESMKNVVATDSTARPVITRTIGSGSATQYDIVASDASLTDGVCQPNATGETYVCLHTVGASSSETGAFITSVETGSTDRADNALSGRYTHTSGIGVNPGPMPTATFSPTHGSTITTNTDDITIVFDGAIYTNSAGLRYTNSGIGTSADDAVKLGTTEGGNTIGFDATISGNTVTIDPSGVLPDGTVFVSFSGWYFGAAAKKTAGVEQKASFSVNAVAPTIVSTTYGSTSGGGSSINAISAGSDLYSILTFSEPVAEVQADNATARPGIKSKAVKSRSDTIAEFQYDIVAPNDTLASGDCKANANKTVYTCLYTTDSALTGDNVFKTFVTVFGDGAAHTGTPQTYATTSASVSIVSNTSPTATFSPTHGSTITTNTDDITIAFDGTIYANGVGTAFTNTTIDNAVKLGTTEGGNTIGFDATISGNTVTIDPSGVLPDGTVFVSFSGWYFGTSDAKERGVDQSFSFTIDTTAPTVLSVAYYSDSGLNTALSRTADTNATIYTKIVFSESMKNVVATDSAARPVITRTIGSGSATQYDIVASDTSLTDGVCQPNATGETYVCLHTVVSSEDGILKTSIDTGSTDKALNAMQARYTDTSTVVVNPGAGPGAVFSPTDGGVVGVGTGDITISFDGAIYANRSGTAYTNSTIDDDIRLGTTDGGNNIRFDATISGNTITINPSVTLSDGSVFVSFSGWYHGSETVKVAGLEKKFSFTVNTAGVSITINTISGDDYIDDTEDESPVTISGTSTNLSNGDAVSVVINDLDNDNRDSITKNTTVDRDGEWTTSVTSAQVKALAEGDVRITVTGTNGASSTGTGTKTIVYDRTVPTIVVADTGYFATYTAATKTLSNPIKSGTSLRAGSTVFTKISFSENMKIATGSGSSGRPVIKRRIGSTETQYSIATATTSLTNGVCIPNDTTNANVFVCSYTVTGGDNGAFTVAVSTDSTDRAGNALQATYTHQRTITLDNAAPTVAETFYSATESGGYSNSPISIAPGNDVYTKIVFSEAVSEVESNTAAARPVIRSKATKGGNVVVGEFQYDIVNTSSALASGDCKETGSGSSDGKEYICRYSTLSSLTETNVFKTFVTAFTDLISTAGIAQTFAGVTNLVNIENSNAAVTVSFSPADKSVARAADTNVAISFSGAIYADSAGTAFTDTTIDTIVKIKETNDSGNTIPANITISGSVITINPNSDLGNGDTVYVAISDGWYYGVNDRKTQGSSATSVFTVDIAAPTVTSSTPDLADADDTGESNTDNLTKTTQSLTFTGTLNGNIAADEFVQLYNKGTKIDGATDSNLTGVSSRDWSIDVNLAGGTHEITARVLDQGGNEGVASGALSVIVDNTAPTIISGSTGYYTDTTLNTVLDGSFGVGTDVYTKVVFSENTTQVIANNVTARPIIKYEIAGVMTQYTIIDGSVLRSGECTQTHGSSNTAAYTCRYTVGSQDNGVFTVVIGSATTDIAGNAFDADYRHNTTIQIDNTAPTIQSIEYKNAEKGGSLISGVMPGDNIYSVISFSEPMKAVKGSGSAARPAISLRAEKGGSATVPEDQYEIAGETDSLVDGRCKPNAAGDVYTCMFTTPDTLTGSNIFKTFVTEYKDVADNSGAAQTYESVLVPGVNIDPGASNTPTVTFSPEDGSKTNSAEEDITITFSNPIYANRDGRPFSNITVDSIVSLTVNGSPIALHDDDVTVANGSTDTVITINPKNDFLNGQRVGVGVSNAWYHGLSTVKVRGASASAAFVIDTRAPSVSSVVYKSRAIGGDTVSDAAADRPIYSIVSFSEEVVMDKSSGTQLEIVYKTKTPIAYDSDDGFEFDRMSSSPSGAVATDSNVFVVSNFSKVYTYNLDGARDSNGDFTLDTANSDPDGIGISANKFYVVDSRDDKVYTYGSDGTRSSTDDFDLSQRNSNPQGITGLDDILYVVDSGDRKVYAYSTDGTRDESKDFDLDSANRNPRGITTTPGHFFVVDNSIGLKKIYAYTHKGYRDVSFDMVLESGNGSPLGIAATETHLFVIDSSDTKAYAYKFDEEEHQYDIVAASERLRAGDCKPNADGTIYTCLYTTDSTLTGSNTFKTYVTEYEDLAGNSGTAQTYATNTDGVLIAANETPTVSFSPADGGIMGTADGNITVTFATPIYADEDGTLFADSSIESIVSMSVDGNAVRIPDSNITIANNVGDSTITITPPTPFTDGATVTVTISSNWYHGTRSPKTRGDRQSATFTVNTVDPSVTSVEYKDGIAGNALSSLAPGGDIYSVITFSKEMKKVESSTTTARPILTAKAMKDGSDTIAEFQYNIVSVDDTLASGDCKPNADGTIYTCLYTTDSTLTGSNTFKTYVTEYEDLAGNSGTAQTYATNTDGVNVVGESTATNFMESLSHLSIVPSAVFGISMTFSDGKIYVGARGDSNGAGAIYIIEDKNDDGDYTDTDEIIKIGSGSGKNSIPLRSRDWFGTSIAVENGKIYVGAMGRDEGGRVKTNSGAIYIIEDKDDDGNYTEQGEVVMISGANGTNGIQSLAQSAEFGKSIAVENGKIYVGAWGDSNGAGAVYVIEDRDSDGNYTERGEVLKISNSSPGLTLENGDRFGHSVAVENGKVFVGAASDNTGGRDAGAVYVVEDKDDDRRYGEQGEVAKISNSSAGLSLDAGDQFGTSVVVSNGVLYVGAWGDDDGASNAGAVYGIKDNDSDGVYGEQDEVTKISGEIGEGGGAISLEANGHFGTAIAVGADGAVYASAPESGVIVRFQAP